MPSCDLFEQQNEKYKDSVLPSDIKNRIVIEAGATLGWFKYAGLNGKVIGVDTFGKSGKYEDVYNFFNLTKEHLVEEVKIIINQNKK
jgi:transketolase